MKIKKTFLLMAGLSLLLSCAKDDDGSPQETKPVLNILDAETTEGEGNRTMTFTVELVGENETNVVVSYSTLGGTAESAIDFEGKAITELLFAAGETSKTIHITIKGDELVEPDETFEILLLRPVNAELGQDRATGTILDNDGQAAGPNPLPTEGFSSPLDYPGYTLVWQDEFQTPALNPDFWTFETGNNNGWGNNELQFYRQENLSMLDNEYLVIEARKEAFGGFNYTSSRIKTQGKKFFQYGRIDIRAALPRGQGIWPALWMLGQSISSIGWPACGEIDIMENVGHQASTVYGTLHWEQNGHAQYGGNTTLADGKFSEQFHVFSIIWNQSKIQWLLDDEVFHEADITPAAMSEFQSNFFLIFNVAVGGNWPGNPDASTVFPQRMYVDYVRVFQQ